MLDLIIGGVAAIICIGFIQFLFPNKVMSVWRTGIVIAAIIYVGFVIQKGAWDFLYMELIGVGIYSILAWLSLKYNNYWLALAWALHIGWDMLLHDSVSTSYVPVWYPVSCIGFDIIIACYVLACKYLRKPSIAK